MTRDTFFPDNCGKQFKFATSFGDCGIHVANEPTRRLHVEAHYYGACHGKSLWDSEGGVVKTFARNQVVFGRMRILGSYDLYEKLKADLDFELREANMMEFGEYSGEIGTGQMFMTRTDDVVSKTNHPHSAN